MISSYLTVNAYAEFHRWLGRGEALTPMWDAWAGGDRKLANELIPDCGRRRARHSRLLRSLPRARSALHRRRGPDPFGRDRPFRDRPHRSRRGPRAALDGVSASRNSSTSANLVAPRSRASARGRSAPRGAHSSSGRGAPRSAGAPRRGRRRCAPRARRGTSTRVAGRVE